MFRFPLLDDTDKQDIVRAKLLTGKASVGNKCNTVGYKDGNLYINVPEIVSSNYGDNYVCTKRIYSFNEIYNCMALRNVYNDLYSYDGLDLYCIVKNDCILCVFALNTGKKVVKYVEITEYYAVYLSGNVRVYIRKKDLSIKVWK